MGHSVFFLLVMAPANCFVKDTMASITLMRKWMYDCDTWIVHMRHFARFDTIFTN